MIVTSEHKMKFAIDGFIILRDFVPRDIIARIISEINSTTFGSNQHKNYGNLRKDKRFDVSEDLSGSMINLYNKYIKPLGDEILEDGNVFADAQYSLIQSGREASLGWHIDGTWIATDANSFDGIPFFKLLIGVYLTDLTRPERGNLMVSSGGHKVVADFFRKAGADICKNPRKAFHDLYSVPIADLQPVLVNPGDIVVAHALLPHTISVNNGPDRPVVYFRLGNYSRSGYAALSDIWSEWPEAYRNIH